MIALALLALVAPPARAEDAPAPEAPEGAGQPAPAPAEAPVEPPKGGLLAGVAVHGAEDFRFRYWHVPEKLQDFEDRDILDYAESVDRLDLSTGTERWTLGARVDAVALFANRYILDGDLHHERDLVGDGLYSPLPDAYFVLEKAFGEVRGSRGSATLGDSYVSFGRGLALNLVKNTEIDVDTSLRGARGVLHAGSWDVTAATGWTNPQQIALENPNEALQPGLRHGVHALRVERWGIGPFNLGLHGVATRYERAFDADAGPWVAYGGLPDAIVGGATVEALGLAGLDWFVEGDVYHYAGEGLPDELGHAIYASVAAYPGRFSVLAEARRAYGTEPINAYAAPDDYEIAAGPTLEYERTITEDSAAAVNSDDIVGGRVRVDLRLGGDLATTLIPYVSVAGFRDEDLGSLHFNPTPETIGHAVAGLQFIRNELHVLANAGGRVDVRDPGANGEDWGADRVAHADVDLSVPVGGPFTLEATASALRYLWGVNPFPQADYVDVSTSLALKVGAPWTVILYSDWSDNPLVKSEGNLGREELYGAAELQWQPGPATTIKAFYGAYRAGIRCAGGQCRQLPGFEGAKVSLTTAF